MRTIPVLVAAFAVAASACSPNSQTAAPTDTAPDRPADDPSADPTSASPSTSSRGTAAGTGGGLGLRPRFLTPFADCSAFLDHVKGEASARVGPYGLDPNPWGFWEGDVLLDGTVEMAAEEPASDAGSGRATAPAGTLAPSGDSDDGGAGGADFTGTNVQELGVDEPDIVKTDGERILAVSEGRLSYIDLTGDPTLTDSLQIPEGWGHELFIRGDRALLFTNGGQWGYPLPVDVPVTDAEADFATDATLDIAFPEQFGPATLVVEVDLSNPADLRIVSSLRIEGQYLSARAIDERVRLAVTSPPVGLPWLFPQNENGEERATEANRRVIDESTLDDWLPSYELSTGGDTVTGTLLDCDRAHRPADFAGFDMISVIDLDLATGLAGSLDRADAVGVMAGGQTVYSSTDRFYVATTEWAGADVVGDDARVREWSEDYETDIHAFAISPGEPTEYVASGTIAGSLLNQFSLDEHEGYLRAITTDGSPWTRDGQSETHLVVFEEQGDRLVAVGEVGGLGRGEQLYSARLMGDVGFAVTFRQIDPFYVLDLSDPTDPRVAGELKIPGFSTYLHPIGDDRVLGVGQHATEDGAVTGVKLSLFDVSDPADPREVSVWTMENAQSPVEWDHRAFQIWGTTAIVPVQTWDQRFNGAVLFDIGEAISEIGRVTHVREDAVPTSDCRVLTGDDVPQETELWWMITDGASHVQLCDAANAGGWGNWWCDVVPVEELRFWFGDPASAEDALATLGADADDRIEICWPDGGYQEAIQRSLVVDGTLWTMTPGAIQGNSLDGLGVVATFGLR